MDYVALHVEQSYDRSEAEVQQLTKNIALAKELGAKLILSAGTDIVDSVVRVARQEKITHIIVGRQEHPSSVIRIFKRRDTAGRLIQRCHDIDIFTANKPINTRPKVDTLAAYTPKELWRHGIIAFLALLLTLLGCLSIRDIL
jgi:two-component system sensor histidine kinase KdpD